MRFRYWLADTLEDWAERVRPEAAPLSMEQLVSIKRAENALRSAIFQHRLRDVPPRLHLKP